MILTFEKSDIRNTKFLLCFSDGLTDSKYDSQLYT